MATGVLEGIQDQHNTNSLVKLNRAVETHSGMQIKDRFLAAGFIRMLEQVS